MISRFLTIATILAALAGKSSAEVEHLRNDYLIRTKPTNGHRLSGWNVLSKNNKCDMVRRHIKTFGYCWKDENEQRNINTTKERGWVREVIQQWEKCGGIKFVEEPKCRDGPDFVTVNIGNYAPILMPILNLEKCDIYAFQIFMDFYTFGLNIESYARTEKVRKSNIQMYALHEFGHFLGFDHEHNRQDRLKDCHWQVDASQTGSNPIYGNYYMTTQYDLDSIMNYCRPNGHYKPWLSKLDKQAVREAYGGGNQAECDAVTKPWKWGPGEGLDEWTLIELEADLNGVTPTKPSTTTSPPGECIDRSPHNDCPKRIQNCGHESMKYWCAKTCGFCK